MSVPQHEWASEYALGFLTDDEARAYELHLDSCAQCQAEVAEFSAVAEALAEPGDGEPTTAPPGLAERVAHAVAMTPQDRPESSAPPASEGTRPANVTDLASRRPTWRARLLTVAAAVAGLAVVWVGAVTLGDGGDQTLADVERIQEAADVIAAPLGLGDATAYVSASEGVAVVGTTPELPEGQQYQMWVVPADGSAPIPGPTMDSGDSTAAWLTALEDAAAVAVSVEPEGGSTTPTEVVSAVEL